MSVVLFNTYRIVVPVMNYIAKGLKSKGIICQSLVVDKNYRVGIKDDEFTRPVKIPKIFGNRKLLIISWYSLTAIRVAMFGKISTAIIFSQPPLLFILLSRILKARNIKFAIHIMDAYPDILWELGYLKKNGPMARLLNNMAVGALNRASYVVTIGRCMSERFIENGVIPEKIQLIPVISFDEKPFQRFDGVTFKTLHDKYSWLDEKLVITYAGNMGQVHSFREILETMRQLKKAQLDESVVFIFIGSGAKEKVIKGFVEEHDLRNVRFYESIPKSEPDFEYLLYRSHFHLITMEDGFQGTSVPSKFYTALYSGSRVLYIGPKQSELHLTISEHDLGLTLRNDTEELFERISEMLKAHEFPLLFDSRIEALYNEQYHSVVFSRKYLDFIDRFAPLSKISSDGYANE